MSMSMLDGILFIYWGYRLKAEEQNGLFTTSLIDTIMQDDDKRERSNE